MKKFTALLLVALLASAVQATAAMTPIGVMQNAAAPLVTPTYDGSGQVTEPSIANFPGGWHGFTYWLAVAPYPHSHAAYENPSILVSNNGTNWSVPPGGS